MPLTKIEGPSLGAVTITTSLSGNGHLLTSLNATSLASGTVALDRLHANVVLTTSTTGINASALTPWLVEAFKELYADLQETKARLAALEG